MPIEGGRGKVGEPQKPSRTNVLFGAPLILHIDHLDYLKNLIWENYSADADKIKFAA